MLGDDPPQSSEQLRQLTYMDMVLKEVVVAITIVKRRKMIEGREMRAKKKKNRGRGGGVGKKRRGKGERGERGRKEERKPGAR